MLRFDTIRSLVLSAGMVQTFPTSPGSLFDRQIHWQRSFRVAAISKVLAKNFRQAQQPRRVADLARIFALAEDYDTALMGMNFVKPLKPAEVSLLIKDGKGKHYDPAVVDALWNELGGARPATDSASELTLRSGQVKPGMTPLRDLMTRNGEMLLSKRLCAERTAHRPDQELRAHGRTPAHYLRPYQITKQS